MRFRIIVVALLAGILFGPAAWAADYVLIANKANPTSLVSAQDAKNIFLGKKSSWSSGEKIVVFTQSGSPVHGDFTKDVVAKTPQQFSTFWKKALFTGSGIPPKDLEGDDAMLKAVAARSGTIGYVSAGSIDDTVMIVSIR